MERSRTQPPTSASRAVPLALAACAALAALGTPAAAQRADDERSAEEIFSFMKRRMDKNFDGLISESEWTRSARAFRRADVDRDGVISLSDVEASRAKRRGDARRRGTPAPEPKPATPPAELDAETVEFFESNVRPVLATHCYSCHSESASRIKGGLRVDSLEHLLKGGLGGPALVPGDPEASSLIEVVRYEDPMFAMPPKEKLPDDAIRDLERWVRMGAPWPAEAESPATEGEVVDTASGSEAYGTIDLAEGRQFWSFQPIETQNVPEVERDEWALGDVDRFLLAGMEEAGVAPAKDADDETWLRRVTFDLTGLPPRPSEVADFLEDRSDERYEHVVDRLLASSAYAERFGRHWLDVARYAESSGKASNVVYPHAWRYRDWVIDAFGDDMPFDQFVMKQIAGDLLPADSEEERASNQIATGYLAVGPKSHQARDPRQFRLDLVDEQVDAISQGMLGLTLSCARCHDHKFDPIPTEDYYAFAGILMSTETLYGTQRAAGNNHASGLIDVSGAASLPAGPNMDEATRRFFGRALDRVRPSEPAMDEMNPEEMTPEEMRRKRQQERRRQQQGGLIESLLSRFDDRGRATDANRVAMGVREAEAIDLAVLDRGEIDRPRGVALRGVPQVLEPEPFDIVSGSGRLELAQWIASGDNPLTARVWVNRVWHHMFGVGLVATPDNFGQGGKRPTHPELLDHLAASFVQDGWSTKALVRELALSRAYRLSSKASSRARRADPENATYARMRERRLEAEAVRDAMLVVSGTLEAERPVGSPTNALEGRLQREEVTRYMTRERPVRSVYMPALRGYVTDAMEAFDAPDAAFVTGAREATTSATQALYMMNDSDVLRLSDAFAERLLELDVKEAQRIEAAFVIAFGREPEGGEARAVRSFLKDYERSYEGARPEAEGDKKERRRRNRRRGRLLDPTNEPGVHANGRRAAWSAFAQSLFQSAEFRAIS
ncbi:MAG: DUF1553 domain-containing protein [Planctomycetota bacterium]